MKHLDRVRRRCSLSRFCDALRDDLCGMCVKLSRRACVLKQSWEVQRVRMKLVLRARTIVQLRIKHYAHVRS